LSSLRGDEGAVTRAMVRVGRFSGVSIASIAFVDVRQLSPSERFSFETGTDDRYAFDPGINAVPMSSSLE